jgi:hypothetical protein
MEIGILARLTLLEMMTNRERYVKAWVAETGLQPTESEMVEDHTDPLRIVLYIRKRAPEGSARFSSATFPLGVPTDKAPSPTVAMALASLRRAIETLGPSEAAGALDNLEVLLELDRPRAVSEFTDAMIERAAAAMYNASLFARPLSQPTGWDDLLASEGVGDRTDIAMWRKRARLALEAAANG